jgi:hypothetical protein
VVVNPLCESQSPETCTVKLSRFVRVTLVAEERLRFA